MIDPRLTKLDLNLLKVFAEIYQTNSISEAAKRLDLAQPSVSRSLQRMRTQLNDQLFIREGRHLIPTPRATELGEGLTELLTKMAEKCFPISEFDVNNFHGRINLIISGALIDAIGVSLVDELATSLPNADIHLTHWSSGSLKAFEQNEIVLGISYFPLSIGQNIRQIPIFVDKPIVLMRKGHPLANIDLKLDTITKAKLTGMVIPELSEFQAIIANLFKDKGFNYKLRSDYLPSIYHQIQRSDLLFFVLEFAARAHPKQLIRKQVNLSLPEMSVALYYHERFHHHPVYGYVSNVIKQHILTCKESLN